MAKDNGGPAFPSVIEYGDKKYQFLNDDKIGSCAKCAGKKDGSACDYLSKYCEGGYFIEKRGPGRPKKE